MSKKTIPVAYLLEKANNMLENSIPELVEARKSVANFISDILSQTGNYKGFGYLNPAADNSGVYGKDGRVFFYVAENLKQDYAKYEIARKNS